MYVCGQRNMMEPGFLGLIIEDERVKFSSKRNLFMAEEHVPKHGKKKERNTESLTSGIYSFRILKSQKVHLHTRHAD